MTTHRLPHPPFDDHLLPVMNLQVRMPQFVFDDLETACRRRGLPLPELVMDAFVRAILADDPSRRDPGPTQVSGSA